MMTFLVQKPGTEKNSPAGFHIHVTPKVKFHTCHIYTTTRQSGFKYNNDAQQLLQVLTTNNAWCYLINS